MKRLYFALVTFALLMTGCYKDDIWQIHKEIDSLRNVTISSLSEQADAMESSISDLNSMNETLQSFVDAIENSGQNVSESLVKIQEMIKSFREVSDKDIEKTVEDFLKKIDDLDSSVKTELSTFNSFADDLKKGSESIQNKIDLLRLYLDNTFAEKAELLDKEHPEKALATLDVQNKIIDDITSIRADIKAMNDSAEDLNKMLQGVINNALDEFVDKFQGSLKTAENNIVNEYTSAIQAMEKALNESNTAAIEAAAAKSESSVMSWINSQLDDYLTIAQAQAQINAMNLILGEIPEGKSLQVEIDDLVKDIATARGEIKEAYAEAIVDAIMEHESVLTKKMEDEINSIRTDFITPINNKLTPIDKDVKDIQNSVLSLETNIKSCERQVDAINSSIAILITLDKTLEEYIGAVKSELDANNKKNNDILQGLIDALSASISGSSAASLPSQIEKLKTYVGTIPSGASETTVADWINTTLTTLENQQKTMATISYVDGIFGALTTQLGTQTGQIAQLESDLDNLLTANRTKIEGWIDTKLAAYYKKGEIDGKLSSFSEMISTYFQTGDAPLKSRIEAVKSDVDAMKTSLETEYKAAIETAITTEKGKVTTSIANQFAPVDTAIGELEEKTSSLSEVIEGLTEQMADYNSKVESLESRLATLKIFLSASDGDKDYSTLKKIIDDLNKQLDDLDDEYATKDDFDNLYDYVTGDLAKTTAKVDSLCTVFTNANDQLEAISDFLGENSDDPDDVLNIGDATLKDYVDDIRGAVDSLMTAVNGTETIPSIAAQIDTLYYFLYGEDKDPENPATTSLLGMLQTAELCVASRISSITYVPTYLDQRETFNNNGGKVSATFTFIIKPASAAKVLSENADKYFKMKFKQYGSPTLYTFESQSVSISEDGTVSVMVNDSRTNLLLDADRNPQVSSALFYEVQDAGGNIVSSFSTKFIDFYYDTTSTGEVPLADGKRVYLFDKEGGTVTITVGQSDYTVSRRQAYWLIHRLENEPSEGLLDIDANTRNIARGVVNAGMALLGFIYDSSWVTVTPPCEYFMSTLQYPHVDYYEGIQEITITVAPNTTGVYRQTDLVFKVIDSRIVDGLAQLTDRDLIITIKQKG